MAKDIYDAPVLRYLFKAAKTIPINPKSEDAEAYESAFVQIEEALEDGDLLCIFPEGNLTPDGEVADFRSGVLKILESKPVPVIPTALRGLWGSYFTRAGKGLWKGSAQFFSKIEVEVAESITAEGKSTEDLRDSVVNLRGATQ